MTGSGKREKRNKGLLAIAIFKFAKASILCVVAVGALNLLHKDVAGQAEHWIDMLRIDPDNRYIAAALEKLQFIHTRELKELSALTFFYAALFFTESIGLAFEKTWAEWLTIVATGLFIPVEIYELCKEPSVVKAVLLLINVLVVIFLAFLVRNRQGQK
ncbi:MAG: DUF2127 domain-containing protein [Spartobacteria bacterium]